MIDYKLYIDELECDLPTDFSIEFEYAVADLSNVGTRTGSVLKDFTLPFTDNNRIATGYSENVESGTKMNQNTLRRIRLEAGGEDLTGYARIQTIEDGYTVAVLQDNAEWLALIDGLNLSDLNMSAYNHVRNITNVEASWNAAGGIYDGTFVYDFIDRGGNSLMSVHDVYPALRMYSLLLRIFNEAGFNISSAFLASADFQKKYVGFTNEDLIISETLVDSVKGNMLLTGLAGNYLPHPSANQGPLGAKIPLDTYTFPLANLGSNLTPNVVGSYSDTLTVAQSFQASLTLKATLINISTDDITYVLISIRKNLQIIGSDEVLSIPLSGSHEFSIETPLINFLVGDEICVRIISEYPFIQNSYIDKATSSFQINPINKCVQGATVDWSLNMPKLSQIDFIKLCKELFNLYFFTDINTRTVYIEPMDEFYETAATALDWSEKVNLDEQIRIEFFDEQRQLTFDFKEDSKDVNYKYQRSRFDYIYGAVDIELQNKYSTQIQKIGNNFASGSVYTECRNIQTLFNTKLIRVWGENGNAEKVTDFNLRVWDYEGYNTNEYGEYIFLVWFTAGGSVVYSYTKYPKFVPIFWRNVNIDGVDKEGLFMKHYKTLTTIIDNSEKRTFPVWLNFNDIKNYNPRKLIWIDVPDYGGSYYIINRLIGTLHEGQTCQVELVPYTGRQNSIKDRYLADNTLYPVLPTPPIARVGVNLQYDNNGDIIINNNGNAVLRINPDTGEISTTGKPIYATHNLFKFTYQVFFTNSDGRIQPVLTM